MNWKDRYVRETLGSARGFLDLHSDALARVNASSARKALDDAIAEFDDHGVAQKAHVIGAMGQTRKLKRLRLDLHKQHLKPLTKLAAAMRDQVPALGSLRIRTLRIRQGELIARANAVANAAEPHAAMFITAGCSPNFLNELRARIRELEAAMLERIDHTNARSGSTTALTGAARHGRRALHLLDAVIQNTVEDEQLLAAWKAVRRVPKKPGPPRGASSREHANAGDSPHVSAAAGASTPVA